MARLIPPVANFETIKNPGERVVAQALVEQLPNDVVVYHSYSMTRRQRHERTGVEYLQPGEADFVVVDPRRGLLVLEVKDSEIEYDTDNNQWRQKNRSTGKWHAISPFEQAEKNKYALLGRLKEHEVFCGLPPFTTGHAAVFPAYSYEGRLPADMDPAIFLGAQSLKTMKRSIERALEAWCRVQHTKPMTEHVRAGIFESLSPIFKLVPVLWRTIDHEEERLHRLTANQEMILHTLQSQDRARIEGVAGSGKTLLAIAQAQRFAREGKRTLLVCFNEPLATWIDQNLPDMYREQIHVSHFHRLCRTFCKKAGIRFHPPRTDQNDFWMYTAPELLEAAGEQVASEHGFDAIIVDEGQDFADFWWVALDELYRDSDGGKPLIVFLDPKQCIYRKRPMIPGDLTGPFALPTNCRNTRRIADYCAGILGFESVVHPDLPEGVEPTVVLKQNTDEVIRHTRTVVQDWCLKDRGGLESRQIAILTPWDNHKKWPRNFGNVPIVRDFDAWRAGEGVLLATHRRFKGLEADALVLAGVPEPGSSEYYTLADHYVASSRAKFRLVVVQEHLSK